MKDFFAPMAIKVFTGVTLALVIACALLFWRNGALHEDKARLEADLKTANLQIDALELAAEIDTATDLAREQSHDRIDAQERELDDARTHQGDDADTAELRTLCVKLRQQRVDTRDHPACSRFARPAGTANP